MEDTLKDQSSVSGNKGGGSATKSKDDKQPVSVSSTASASRRGRPSSNVSQSVTATVSPVSKPASNIIPIFEARSSRSRKIEAISDTPVSDVSRSLSRRKFSVLSSASYWISQIKLSEAAGKHKLSFGFFKLAQVAACENPQLLRDELKSYALRHNILELGESAKEVLQIYGISENIEQVQVSVTDCSHEPEQGTQSSSEDAHSLSFFNGIHKQKPKSLSNSVGFVVKESAKESNQKKLVSNTKATTVKKTVNQHSASEAAQGKMQKHFQKPIKKESNRGKQMVKRRERNLLLKAW